MFKLHTVLLTLAYFGVFCFLMNEFTKKDDFNTDNISTISAEKPLESRQRQPSEPFCLPGTNSDCVPPFKYIPSKFRIAPHYSLGACVIEKSMSTVMAAIMCMLYNVEQFRSNNRTLHTELWGQRFCKNQNEFVTLREVRKVMRNATLIAVVREPIQRFLSGFTDKCVKNTNRCYNCKGNMTCFVEKQYKRMMDFSNGKSRGLSFEDIHFDPQSWYCNFRDNLFDYEIIHYGSSGKENHEMTNKIGQILRRNGVEDDVVREIQDEIRAKKTPHATVLSSERKTVEEQLYLNKNLLRTVVKMYYYDYILFGFQLPNIE